jgi:hypothetical protein
MTSHSVIKSEIGIAMLKQAKIYYEVLPEIEEFIDGFGHSVVKVKKKSFLIMGEGEQGLEPGMSIKADKETQQLLISQGNFYKTPYIGQHGWVSIRANHIQNWDEIGQLIVEAYLRQAPKKLTQAYLATKQAIK